MIFDNLTLVGVLFTLPYIVLAIRYGKKKATSAGDAKRIANSFINESGDYAARGESNIQPVPDPCRSCA